MHINENQRIELRGCWPCQAMPFCVKSAYVHHMACQFKQEGKLPR